MTKLDEIKAKYPLIDVNLDGGNDSYQEGAEVIERHPLAVVIKHPDEDEYLIADWKNADWKGFLTGGVEGGDTVHRTVLKEVYEETGYKNISKVIEMDCVAHSIFFHPVKKVNRLAHYHLVFAELADLEQDEVAEEEKAIAEFIWVPRDNVLDLLSRIPMKKLWEFYILQAHQGSNPR